MTGPRLIRLPPVLDVWFGEGAWFANTTRGLYSWGLNSSYVLGIGEDRRRCAGCIHVLQKIVHSHEFWMARLRDKHAR